jgi:hypothetical protein
MLKFARTLEQDKAAQNTFRVLFGDPVQRKAIEDMNKAAELGLVEPSARMGLNLQTISTLKQAGAVTGAAGTGYVFFMTPEQQQKVQDNLGTLAVSAGGLVLTQRQLAKALLDPQGAKAISLLSKAKQQALSPTVFTKLVVEPLNNIFSRPAEYEGGIPTPDQFDLSTLAPRR